MIRRFASISFATALAVTALSLLLAGSASATGSVTIGTGSTTASIGSMTLRDSSLGNLILATTLSITLAPGRIVCDLASGVTIGGVTGARIVFSSPAGYSGVPDFSAGSWPITTRCALRPDGSLDIVVSGIRFSVIFGFIGTYVFDGSFLASVSPDGRLITGRSSSFSSDRRTTANFLLPWSLHASPAIVWALA